MLDIAFEPVQRELELTEVVIREETFSGIDIADEIRRHLALSGGKRIRPAVLLLSSELPCAERAPEETRVRVAAALELMHTASLMHDDVVDGCTVRRGKRSANGLWGDKASVLTGDFLWSVASKLIVGTGDNRLMEIVIDGVRSTTLGEILELSNNGNPRIDENICLRIIEGKTAALFEVAARAGAMISGATQDEENALAEYGRLIGMSFQLRDDAMDYSAAEEAIGKKPGTDLGTGTPTLPFISSMLKASSEEAGILEKALRSDNGSGLDDALPIIERLGGIDHTMSLSTKCSSEAKELLSAFPSSSAKSSLNSIADFCSTIVES